MLNMMMVGLAQAGTLTVWYDDREMTFETAVCEEARLRVGNSADDLEVIAWATPNEDGDVVVMVEVDYQKEDASGKWRHHSENLAVLAPDLRHVVTVEGRHTVDVRASGFGTVPGGCLARTPDSASRRARETTRRRGER
jgi:hypothetical protein